MRVLDGLQYYRQIEVLKYYVLYLSIGPLSRFGLSTERSEVESPYKRSAETAVGGYIV